MLAILTMTPCPAFPLAKQHRLRTMKTPFTLRIEHFLHQIVVDLRRKVARNAAPAELNESIPP